MIINIKKDDINKDIYFLDDIDEKNDEYGIKFEHNKLEEMNESNTDLYINNIKFKYKNFLNFKKKENII